MQDIAWLDGSTERSALDGDPAVLDVLTGRAEGTRAYFTDGVLPDYARRNVPAETPGMPTGQMPRLQVQPAAFFLCPAVVSEQSWLAAAWRLPLKAAHSAAAEGPRTVQGCAAPWMQPRMRWCPRSCAQTAQTLCCGTCAWRAAG